LPDAKYEYANIQRKVLLEDALKIIVFILVCYVAHTAKYLTYLLKTTYIWLSVWR